MNKSHRAVVGKSLLVLMLIFITIGLAVFFVKSRPVAQKKTRQKVASLVEVQSLESVSEPVVLHVTGTVIPVQEVQIEAEVSGLITYVNPMLVAGGVVSRGDILLKLDDRSYQAQLRVQKDALVSVRSELKLEEGQQDIARSDWAYMERMTNMDARDRSFALREPQLEAARAMVDSAEALVAEARYQLERTVITAPFDAVVKSVTAEVGGRAAPGANLVQLIGTEAFYIEASLRVSDLKWITCHNSVSGSVVHVIMNDGQMRQGEVMFRLPDLDEKARMAKVLVRVDDPLGLKNAQPPLLLHDFLSMEIIGATESHVYRIPRTAFRNGREIWLAQMDHTLHIAPVQVVWGDKDFVFIRGTWNPDCQLVISDLATPVEGMKLMPSKGAATDKDNP